MERVFVAMSGGVDSSVAALRLQQTGHAVVGITFKLFTNEDVAEAADRPCCSLESVARARAVCDRLGVPHYTFNLQAAFREFVMDPFCAEYAAGRTPNPCVLCNRHIKFAVFLRQALALGADCIATGHHARIAPTPAGRFALFPGHDLGKDQSYALCHLNQTTMARVRLPVGELRKAEVRALAAAAGLPTAATPESQDLCFVRAGHYSEFLAAHGVPAAPGPIVTREGAILGEHRGLHHYTVGQRKGLRLSPGGPYFVAEKRVADNTLVVVREAELRQVALRLEEVNWCDGEAGAWPEAWPAALRVMLRYRARPVPCAVEASNAETRTLVLRLSVPQVVAPGQYGVLYGPDGHVVAGGTIS